MSGIVVRLVLWGKTKSVNLKDICQGPITSSFSLFIEQYSVLYMAQKCQWFMNYF